jgi:hypothetical protein
MSKLENRLINWYMVHHYNQGDQYYVSLTKDGKYRVAHTNDYPLQHGKGGNHVLTDSEFLEANRRKYDTYPTLSLIKRLFNAVSKSF